MTSDRHVKNVSITKSSNLLWYDKSVIDAVYKLDGDFCLTFPEGSQRKTVSVDIGLQYTGGPSPLKDLYFGDIEQQKLPSHDP